MSGTLEFFKEAKAEAEEATRFYERQVPGLGDRFQEEVVMVCAAILRNPLLWRERHDGYRRVNLPNFPYYIAYFIRDERILVAAVGHASRLPGYWRHRDS